MTLTVNSPGRLIASALNACLAAFLGGYFAGWAGALIGFAALVLFASASFWLPLVYRTFVARNLARAAGATTFVWSVLRPSLAILMLPIILPITTLAALALHVGGTATKTIAAPLERLLAPVKRAAKRGLTFLATFFVEPAFSLTIANLLAVVVIVGVVLNIEFAKYVIFAFLPVMGAFLAASSFADSAASGRA